MSEMEGFDDMLGEGRTRGVLEVEALAPDLLVF